MIDDEQVQAKTWLNQRRTREIKKRKEILKKLQREEESVPVIEGRRNQIRLEKDNKDKFEKAESRSESVKSKGLQPLEATIKIITFYKKTCLGTVSKSKKYTRLQGSEATKIKRSFNFTKSTKFLFFLETTKSTKLNSHKIHSK